MVSRYLSCPCKVHWQAVKWILRYLKGTSVFGLESGKTNNIPIGYVDSDYVGDLDKMRSLTGHIFTIRGCVVSWIAILQYTIALSITEAVKEVIWLRDLLGELSMDHGLTVVHCDSQSTIHLTKDQLYLERTKHIDVLCHFIRDIFDDGYIKILKIGTKNNLVDMLTKSLLITKFEHCFIQ